MFFTGSVGSDYDSVPYDAIPDGRTDMRRIAALSALYGGNAHPGDVLDLGCGAGRVLAQAAPFVEGRLVGVDASRVLCEAARARLAPYGDRCTILQSEFDQLDFDALGTFDVILCIGALYALSSSKQEALLARIARMLKPGGAIVISYYSGLVGHFRHSVLRLVRENIAQPVAPQAGIAEGRTWIGQFTEVLEQSEPMLSRWKDAVEIDDTIMAHEMLGHGAAPLRHGDLNRVLAAHGVGFVSTLPADKFAPQPTPELRALKADVEDIGGGGYCYTLFVRPTDGFRALDITTPGVTWTSRLASIPGRPDAWRGPDGEEYTIGAPRVRMIVGVIDSLSPDWERLSAEVAARDPGGERAALEAEIVGLWRMGLIEPCPTHLVGRAA